MAVGSWVKSTTTLQEGGRTAEWMVNKKHYGTAQERRNVLLPPSFILLKELVRLASCVVSTAR